MRFTLFVLAVLPTVFAAATKDANASTAIAKTSAVAEATKPSPSTAAGNSTIEPLVDAVVKVTFDVSCGQEISRYRPNCDGACHSVSTGFGGLITNGNGVYGVNCNAYSDSNCSPANYLGQTGNHVSTSTSCYPFSGAHSYICYYRC